SRRRHTRWPRDWSSDVCSSDLFRQRSHSHLASGVCRKNEFLCANSVMLRVSVVKLPGKTFTTEARAYTENHRVLFPADSFSKVRSEERRVGKDSRYTSER